MRLEHLVTPENWEVFRSDGVYVNGTQKLARTGPTGHDWDNLIIMDVSHLSKTEANKMRNLYQSRMAIDNVEGMTEFIEPPSSNHDNTS